MVSDDMARRLHDRATRGSLLSAEEQALLSAWDERHDAEQSALVAPTHAPQSLPELQARVDDALARQELSRQQAAVLEEHRALLGDQRALLNLLLKERG